MISEVTILLADDHALIRSSLSERLAREPGFRVVATAASADEAVEKAAQFEADVILLDIDMDGVLCFEAARQIAKLRPSAKIIFVSAFFHDRYIDQALEVKAHGYLTKNEPPEALIAAIREVLSGGAYFSEQIRSRIVVGDAGARLPDRPRSRTTMLTRREMEILRYIAQGWTKKVIAQISHISPKTVDHHMCSIMNKLDIHSTVDLVRFAIREGLAGA